MKLSVDCSWQHPWLRLQLLIRTMLTERWDAKTWPVIRAELKKALAMRSHVRRAGWFN